MLLVCQSIDAADQVLELVRPFLEELRNISQETAVLGKRQDGQVIYLDVALSHQPIRYHVQVGESRAAHTNSIGKAIFPMLDEKEQKALLAKANWRALTSRTIATREAFLRDMAQTKARGWSSNVGESVEDLAAVALPFQLASEVVCGFHRRPCTSAWSATGTRTSKPCCKQAPGCARPSPCTKGSSGPRPADPPPPAATAASGPADLIICPPDQDFLVQERLELLR